MTILHKVTSLTQRWWNRVWQDHFSTNISDGNNKNRELKAPVMKVPVGVEVWTKDGLR